MTAGRRSLLAVLQRTSGREVAARCRVAPTRVSEWAAGIRLPPQLARAALAANYGISPSSWDAPIKASAVR